MKKPDRYIGFIEILEKHIPFEFDEKTFRLKLYYPTPEEAMEHIMDGFMETERSDHSWVPNYNLKASLATGDRVIFNVSDIPSSFCGYKTYEVYWYYLYSGNETHANGIKISGREIDFFYPPQIALESSIIYDEAGHKISKMDVCSHGVSKFECGSFELNDHVIHVSGAATTSVHPYSSTPMDAKTFLYAESTNAFEIDTAVDIAKVIKKFLMYVTYRSNVSFDSIEVFNRNDGDRNLIGILDFPHIENDEKNERASERIIQYKRLNEKSGLLMKSIQETLLPFQQLCKSIDDQYSYSTSRIIMLLSAFEREFRNIYGQNVGRSDEYVNLKNDVIVHLENMLSEEHGIRRKYLKEIIRGVQNSDNSFGKKIKTALFDCREIMMPFIRMKYDGNLEKIIDEISSRMNTLRNGIAHSSLNLDIDPIHLSDLPIIEQLIYVIRLKEIGLDIISIKRAIADLFHVNIAITR